MCSFIMWIKLPVLFHVGLKVELDSSLVTVEAADDKQSPKLDIVKWVPGPRLALKATD